MSILWLSFFVAVLYVGHGLGWILFALLLSHVFQAVWQTAEHRGLPHEGSMLMRSRSMQPSVFVRWWLWNANYHAEHHAWAAIPWHALPAAHARVEKHLEQRAGGYWVLSFQVLQRIVHSAKTASRAEN